MATKKKVATKGAGKVNASVKKSPAVKKAVQPVASKASPQKTSVKPAPKNGKKPAAVKPVSAKKVQAPVPKKAAKNLPAKSAPKVDALKETIKKIEPVKVMPKKSETKPVEPVSEPVTPAPAKPSAKKEAAPAKAAKVAMPDIKTKSVRKYDPDFTKSVLDSPVNPLNSNSQRYSDSDLIEFRELINKKLDAAK